MGGSFPGLPVPPFSGHEAGHRAAISDKQPHNQEMWRISKWSRNRAGRPVDDPHLPPLRKSPEDPFVMDNESKANLLISQFYPPPPEADLSDIPHDTSTLPRFTMSQDFPDTLLESELKKLPDGKAPGPDGIANEVLKEAYRELAPYLAEAFTAAAQLGYYPKIGKSTTTVVLRKDGKADYSLTNSYRPIALENTIAKVYEKLLASQISQEAEERSLLPPTQMGARPKRSTLSALELIDETVRTAWKGKRKNGNVVSMLSLDISGAFPNTSHERLLYILRRKGFPEWVVQVTKGFIEGQTTRLVAGGLTSQEVNIKTGIPQGSPLSPILFLLFSSELLEILESGDTRGSAFVDDTNMLTVSSSVTVNCRRLEQAHDKCLAWARRHGVKFAPDKYQLIHFTRRRNTPGLGCPIRIQGFDGKPCDGFRVLGVWVDKGLTYHKHAQKAADKAMLRLNSTLRIVQSTWGLTFQHTRLIYLAVVRPTLAYGAPVWTKGSEGNNPTKALLDPLMKVQNIGLRKIAGAYKAASIQSLERETEVEPIDLYLEKLRLHRADKDKTAPVTEVLEKHRQDTWLRSNRPGRRSKLPPLPTSSHSVKMATVEKANIFASEKRRETARREAQNRAGARARRLRHVGTTHDAEEKKKKKPTTPIEAWIGHQWRLRWDRYRENKHSPVYDSVLDAKSPPKDLHAGLSRAKSSMLTQLRAETIGFNDFLAARNVPGATPECDCGWVRQTPRHIVVHCPLLGGREQMWTRAGTLDYNVALRTKQDAEAITSLASKLVQPDSTPTIPRGQRTGGQTAGHQTSSRPLVVTGTGTGTGLGSLL